MLNILLLKNLINNELKINQKWTAEIFTARLKQAHSLSKIDFDNKLVSFNRRITSNKTKYLEVKKKLNSQQKIIIVS